nr:MAG TPA: RNA polymerase-like protein [Caudoviricetes sp.]
MSIITFCSVENTITEGRQFIMICPNCGSENVTISMEQVSSKTKKHGNGIGGHINNAARGLMAVSTLGMSNLVWKKSKGGEKTVVKNQKICLCQNCGNSWEIK